jgi:hypothetical protein
MSVEQQIDITNLDDASEHYGLGHGATSAGSGISRATEAEIEEKKERERRRVRDRRELERRVLEHNREVERSGQGQKWAMPAGEYSNAESYEAIERRTNEIQRERGCSFLEASQIARNEFAVGAERPAKPCTGGDDCECEKCNSVNESTLQREGLDVKGGSNRNGKMKRRRAVKPNLEGGDQVIAGAGGALTELERADEALRLAGKLVNHNQRGRPLKGAEARMVLTGRIEPSQVVDINRWTGRQVFEVLEEMHTLLKMARSGAEAVAIADKLRSLLMEA